MLLPLYFDKKIQKNTLSFYTNKVINEQNLSKRLMQSKKQLKKYDINIDKLNPDIFIMNNDILYSVSMPLGMGFLLSETDAYTLFNTIYFKQTEIDKNKVYYNQEKKDAIPFSIVLPHELVHVWEAHTYGYIKYFFISQWIKEGYAVYVSGELVALEGKRNFLLWLKNNNFQNISSHESYILWALMVKHAIEKMHKSVDDLHLGKVDYDEVLDSMLQEYNIEPSEQPKEFIQFQIL
jgi:hypothetical protein